MMKAIYFSSDKTAPLRKAMQAKFPIKLKNYEFNDKFKNIIIKSNTSIIDIQALFPSNLQLLLKARSRP